GGRAGLVPGGGDFDAERVAVGRVIGTATYRLDTTARERAAANAIAAALMFCAVWPVIGPHGERRAPVGARFKPAPTEKAPAAPRSITNRACLIGGIGLNKVPAQVLSARLERRKLRTIERLVQVARRNIGRCFGLFQVARGL